MFFGNFNNYFGRSKSVFGRSYIDYCIKEIDDLNTEELEIIKWAKLKYFGISFLNFCIFVYSAKMIYKKGILELHRGELALNIRDWFLVRLIVSITSMIYLYRESQRLYYNDLKYIIKKYKFVNKQQYADAVMSNRIAEIYKDKMIEIENRNNL